MPPSAASGETRPFRAFLDRDWDRWMAEFPEVATVVGITAYDDRWTDDSPDGIAVRRRHLEAAAHELGTFRASELSAEDRLDFQLYRELLDTAVEGLAFGHDALPFRFGSPRHLGLPFSQVDGVHLSAPDVLMMQPRGTVAQYRLVLARLERLPKSLDEQVELARHGLAAGWRAPREPMRSVPDQLLALAPEDPAQSPMLRAFVEWPPSLPEAERPALRARASAIYADAIRPALERMRAFVVDEYLPGCRTSVGASEAPNGAAWYAFLARWQTTTSLTPQQIHEIGLREVDRLTGEMETIRRETGFAGTLDEFKAWLRTDRKFTPPSAASIVEAYRSLAKRIDPELAHEFGRLPRLPYGIEPIPEFRAPASPTAYYQGGAPRTGRAGCFYINTYDLPSRPTWEMEPLTLHEAVPGHHLQLALMEELDGLPAFRRHSGYTAFIEGWGLYAETLGPELGLYRDPYARFGRAAFDAGRSARLVVDTGMHALGWSRQQAIDYLLRATGKSERDVVAEIDRYIVWPGQALAYKIGQLCLTGARARAKAKLGDRFDIRAFHDRILADGGLPLAMVDERIDAWAGTGAR